MFKSASGGDTIAFVGVFDGTYLSNRSFTTKLTLDASHAQFTNTLTLDNLGFVELNGGTFNIAARGAYAKGIAVYGGSNIYINSVAITGGAIPGVDQFGISISTTKNAQVQRSTFTGLVSGVSVGKGAINGVIGHNTILGSTSDGIDVADSRGVWIDANTCSGGHPAPGAHPDCVQMWSVAGHPLESDITVTNNKAYGPTQGFTNFDAGLRIKISNNLAQTSYTAGVACYDCVDSIITNNTLSTTPGAPYQTQVVIRGGSGNVVSGNTVAAYTPTRLSGAVAADDSATIDAWTPPFDMSIFDRPVHVGNDPTLIGEALNEDGAALSDTPAAVPEPSSWALLIGGFAAVGVARRRAVGRAVSIAA